MILADDIDNSDPDIKIGGLTEFAGVPVDGTSVLAACTWWGDANLDDIVDSNDYDRIDTNWLLWTQQGRVPDGGFRWAVGDFNYDGTIDSNDYDKIDNAWLLSGGVHLAGRMAARPDPLAPAAAKPVLTESPEMDVLVEAASTTPALLPPETALLASEGLDSEGPRAVPGPASSDLLSLEIGERASRDEFRSGLKAEEDT